MAHQNCEVCDGRGHLPFLDEPCEECIDGKFACSDCGEKPAECDSRCIPCTVTFYTQNPEEFDSEDPAWLSDIHWQRALIRIAHVVRKPREMICPPQSYAVAR